MNDALLTQAIRRRLDETRNQFPGFKTMMKADSAFIRFLYIASGMFLWNRKFMTSYASTIGNTIYLAKPLEGLNGLALLEHELVHLADARRLPRPVWSLAYLFPQCLALLALLAPLSNWFLLALVALGPWPAPFRVESEFRAYRKQLGVLKAYNVPLSKADVDRLEDIFCGWRYWRMSWRWSELYKQFMRIVDPAALLRD